MNDINIPARNRRGDYADMIRVNTRHYDNLCRLADEGGFTSLGQLLGTILDVVLPRVRLIERPKYDVVIVDENGQSA